jgi:HNH endonuclease
VVSSAAAGSIAVAVGVEHHPPLGHRLLHPLARRRPTAQDAAHVQARDRTCRAPGCRIPARHADLDHTRDWAKGGSSTVDNLGVLCRHDHRLKHDGGWTLHQPHPGHFHWTSPLGHTYTVIPPNLNHGPSG